MPVPGEPTERWSLDFVAVVFDPAQRFRILAVIDHYTHDRLAIVLDSSLPGARVARELHCCIRLYGSTTQLAEIVLISVFILNEPLTRIQWVGFTLALYAVTLMALPSRSVRGFASAAARVRSPEARAIALRPPH